MQHEHGLSAMPRKFPSKRRRQLRLLNLGKDSPLKHNQDDSSGRMRVGLEADLWPAVCNWLSLVQFRSSNCSRSSAQVQYCNGFIKIAARGLL